MKGMGGQEDDAEVDFLPTEKCPTLGSEPIRPTEVIARPVAARAPQTCTWMYVDMCNLVRQPMHAVLQKELLSIAPPVNKTPGGGPALHLP